MKKIFFTLPLVLLVSLSGCNQRANTYFHKKLAYPDLLTSDQKVKLSAYVTPTPSQYEWQIMEMAAFIHFGINTFTGMEEGDGNEDPTLFNPTDFDAEQWVDVLQKAGFKMIVLTAKHHDGFCLWPTRTTSHSVSSSPWKNGLGDVVKEVKEACDRHNMKFGIYLSPWDKNAEKYDTTPQYNERFAQQLAELLTHYGEIHEVWLDGAQGDEHNNNRHKYDWTQFYQVIDSLQPNAIKAIMGGDTRWASNENGLGRETQWSVTPLQPDINDAAINENIRLGISPSTEDIGSRELISEAKIIYWYPSEVDVSIRPGWFYHPEEDNEVKTVSQLVDIYFQSVGMNSLLMLNVPPNTRGLLHQTDIERLNQFAAYLTHTFDNEKLTNGDLEWKAAAGTSREFNVTPGEPINTLLLQENIRKGQRVEEFTVEAWINDQWKELAKGTTIGYKRLLRFEDVSTTKLRLTVSKTRDIANISKVGAYHAPSE